MYGGSAKIRDAAIDIQFGLLFRASNWIQL
jgi:hypothetical protein